MPSEPKEGGFWHTIGMIGVVIGVAAVGAYTLDLHGHTCDGCGKTWRHLGAFNMGDHAAHACPACGKIQWWKNIRGDGAFKAEGNRLGTGDK